MTMRERLQMLSDLYTKFPGRTSTAVAYVIGSLMLQVSCDQWREAMKIAQECLEATATGEK